MPHANERTPGLWERRRILALLSVVLAFLRRRVYAGSTGVPTSAMHLDVPPTLKHKESATNTVRKASALFKVAPPTHTPEESATNTERKFSALLRDALPTL